MSAFEPIANIPRVVEGSASWFFRSLRAFMEEFPEWLVDDLRMQSTMLPIYDDNSTGKRLFTLTH
jgi:hypothetical protein